MAISQKYTKTYFEKFVKNNGNTLIKGPILTINYSCLDISMTIIIILAVYYHIFCMAIFYIHKLTQYLNLTTTLLTINKQKIGSLLRQKS